ncbi:MAG: hypothetical protein RLZZ229_111 [Actinomycetota bacterium]
MFFINVALLFTSRPLWSTRDTDSPNLVSPGPSLSPQRLGPLYFPGASSYPQHHRVPIPHRFSWSGATDERSGQPITMIPLAIDSRLAELVALPGVTDVLVNGFESVWLQRETGSLQSISSPFTSEEELAELAQQVIAVGGRQLDQANPFADVAIGPLRVHASLASGCVAKTHLSVRIHSKRLYGLSALCDLGMFNEDQLDLLRRVIFDRQNFLISGATGSGKTTLLRAMLSECVDDRIISIEDVCELQLENPRTVALQTRQPNTEGKGQVDLSALLHQALRMRPDRLVVGEIRGHELVVILQALNTGHTGAGVTIHANSIIDVPQRLISIGQTQKLAVPDLSSAAATAFTWVIHLENRRVEAIGRLFLRGDNRLGVQIV